MKQIGSDREKTKLNVARIKKSGETFEVVIDADKAIEFKKGYITDISEVLHSEHIFDDAKKGLQASTPRVLEVFNVESVIDAAKEIIMHGEIQLTEEYRKSKREEKRRRIIELIHRNAIDPTNGFPIPVTRIENGIEEAKIKIDENKTAEDQIADVLHHLKPIMPIKFETKKIDVRIPPRYAQKAFNMVKKYGTLTKNEWKSDGSVVFVIEIPAGMQEEFFDILNKETHGSAESKIL